MLEKQILIQHYKYEIPKISIFYFLYAIVILY